MTIYFCTYFSARWFSLTNWWYIKFGESRKQYGWRYWPDDSMISYITLNQWWEYTSFRHTFIFIHQAHLSLVPISTLRPRRNEQHFADDIFKRIFFNENIWILTKISLKFVPKGPINNFTALVQIMAWRRPGDKPLSEPMMVSFPTHICVTRAQWVNLTWQVVTIYNATSRKPVLSPNSLQYLCSRQRSKENIWQQSKIICILCWLPNYSFGISNFAAWPPFAIVD